MAADLLRQNSLPFQSKWLSPATYAGVALFTAVLFSALSITDQSFWIDEAVGGVHARNESIFIIFHEMARTPAADLQIPFYTTDAKLSKSAQKYCQVNLIKRKIDY
jgi:hypothetical protein